MRTRPRDHQTSAKALGWINSALPLSALGERVKGRLWSGGVAIVTKLRMTKKAVYHESSLMLLQATKPIHDNSEPISRRPFLKWAGNKNRAKQHILPHLGEGNRLIEPFAGSCAISLNSTFNKFSISDVNEDLINLYKFSKTNLYEILNELKKLFTKDNNCSSVFYDLRDEFNHSHMSIRKSALFIYLNRHGFNGLCRYNSRGGFNVPFGKYAQPYLPEEEIIEFSKFSENVTFAHSDFTSAFESAEKGDVLYCDPPYVPLSSTSNFTSYAKDAFGTDKQILLADLAEAARRKGCRVLISNHDTPFTRELYCSARIASFGVMRLISSKASTRGEARELLAVFE